MTRDKIKQLALSNALISSQDHVRRLDDVMDILIRMLRMSGWECLAEMVKTWENVPVIMVSGASPDHTEEPMHELGAVGFVKKPINFDHFHAVLRRALNQRRRLMAEVECRHQNDADQNLKKIA